VLAWNGSSLTWSNPTEGTNVTAAAASGATSVASYGAKGDGSDDTLAVASCVAANNWVCFPNSVSNLYVLDFVLIHSNNRLTVSPGVTLKMANGQNHAFVTNNWSGTTNVTIEGGIWDANWQNQSYGQNLSQVFNLEFVTNLLARDITIQQTVTGAVNGNAFRCGTWQDLRFVNVNLKMLCGEGIHLSGPGNNAMIDGTRGVTSGDFVALDAADSVRRYPQYDSMGPICNVKVENTKAQQTRRRGAMATRFGTDVGFEVANQALQLHGGYGYMSEYGIGRAWIDARVMRIYGGSSEIMKEIISRSL